MKLTSTLVYFVAFDAFIILLLFFCYDKLCDVPLKWWLFGGLVLSVPSSIGSHFIRGKYGYKAGLLTEVSLLILSLFWMAVGTIEVRILEIVTLQSKVTISTTCQSTNPGIWWTVYILITIFCTFNVYKARTNIAHLTLHEVTFNFIIIIIFDTV
ncbi:hypothetical protein BdWA1_000893 [Babesia duncani]|uniref:Uncharacterized protein n=1 Tax=Babesia duncani TaxID=323732 RepID=A0AAD9UQH6_9APIC|nr:hypothetical protein BdWA1_000893 [Babesia duncani]